MTKMARGASNISFIVSSDSTNGLLLHFVSHRVHFRVDSGTEHSIDHERDRYEDGYADCILCQLCPLLVLKKVIYSFHQATPLKETLRIAAITARICARRNHGVKFCVSTTFAPVPLF